MADTLELEAAIEAQKAASKAIASIGPTAEEHHAAAVVLRALFAYKDALTDRQSWGDGESASAAGNNVTLGPNEIRAMVETFLEEEGVSNPHIIFARVAGSTGYNLAGGRSDLDFYVVYAAQTAAVLLDTVEGSVSVAETVTGKLSDKSGREHDVAAFELRKWCKLVLGGNPQAIEALWSDRLFYAAPEWEAVVAHRRDFITLSTFKAFQGHVFSEIKQMKSKDALGFPITKCLYHAYRNLFQAERVSRGEEPVVWMDDDDAERLFLMDIRTSKTGRTERDLQKELETRLEPLKAMKVAPKKVANAVWEWLNAWQLDIRHTH